MTWPDTADEVSNVEKDVKGPVYAKKLWVKTPLIHSSYISSAASCQVHLKLENLQPSGSFKSRGLGNLCQRAANEKKNVHYYCSSGGNAGLAVVSAARTLGRPSTIVVPKTCSNMMRARLTGAGATKVIAFGDHWSEADAHLRGLLQEDPDGVYCPPFDNPHVWEGNATLVGEFDFKPDLIVCSVGGGGLLIGLIEGLRRRGWDDVPILAVEPEGAASFAKSLQEKRVCKLASINSIAITLGADTVAKKALELGLSHPVKSIVITDAEAAMCCSHLADDHRIMVEAACGAALAPVYYAEKLRSAYPHITESSHVVVIVCGGSDVSVERIVSYRDSYSHLVPNSYKKDVPSTFSSRTHIV